MTTTTVRTNLGNFKIGWPGNLSKQFKDLIASLIRREADETHPIDDLKKYMKSLDSSLGTPANTLETYLELRGWTQAQLSKKTGIEQPHISAMKRGKRKIGLVSAKKYGKAFGINFKRFL